MRERKPIRTREDLLQLIAQAVRLQLEYVKLKESIAIADTVLRNFKAAGLSVWRRKNVGELSPRWRKSFGNSKRG